MTVNNITAKDGKNQEEKKIDGKLDDYIPEKGVYRTKSHQRLDSTFTCYDDNIPKYSQYHQNFNIHNQIHPISFPNKCSDSDIKKLSSIKSLAITDQDSKINKTISPFLYPSPSFNSLSDNGITDLYSHLHDQSLPLISSVDQSSPSQPVSSFSSSALSSSTCPSSRENRKMITIEEQEYEERVFKQDLAHILAWFQDDLGEEQRLTTVYSLMKQLDTWQVSFLAQLLESENDKSTINAIGNSNGSGNGSNNDHFSKMESSFHPMGGKQSIIDKKNQQERIENTNEQSRARLNEKNLDYKNDHDYFDSHSCDNEIDNISSHDSIISSCINALALSPSPSPYYNFAFPYSNLYSGSSSNPNFISNSGILHSRSQSNSPPSSGEGGSGSNNNGEQLEIHANLFWNGDINGWLKALRLHKYSNCFINQSLKDIVNMDEDKLMNIGISTMGARRKFLRIITALKALSHSNESSLNSNSNSTLCSLSSFDNDKNV